jgi:DNA adenine methylase
VRNTVRPPFPYYGGKQTLAERLVALLPPHRHYVEPYAGSLAVLLGKPRSRFETANDLDDDLRNFWEVLRTRDDELEVACGLTPHSRAEHTAAMDAEQPTEDPLERARRTWVLLTQGQSGATGRRTGWRFFSKTAGGSSPMPRYLEGYVERFGPCVARLHGVSLECRPALEVVGTYGRHEDVLLYIDPPYVLSTRKGRGYKHEMTDDDHRALAAAVRRSAATVVLSGYPSDLYDLELFPDWHRVELPAGTGNGGEWRERTEVVWSNRRLERPNDLFELALSATRPYPDADKAGGARWA